MISTQITEEQFLEFFPKYKSVKDKLTKANLPFGIFAGSEVWLLTNSRVPTDLDILVRNEDLKNVAALFDQEVKVKEKPGMSAEYVLIDNVEIVANIQIIKDGKTIAIPLNDEMIARLFQLSLGNDLVLSLLPPEDTIIIKSLLRRGQAEGKFDLQDIDSLKHNVEIDQQYFESRIDDLNVKGYFST